MSTDIQKKIASEQISEILEQIKALTEEAENLAETAGISFSWPNPAYGMGGTYISKAEYIQDYLDPADPYYAEEVKRIMDKEEADYDDGFGWKASSQSC